ncbi:GMC family oxidoreductase N-terminal domain-containing protein [Spirillospora sp. CA-294931]|uniref:GMC family oxidoreductase n=1 Tax=Spirillospora sp. CA-294931 TaxID=3240042 RepID=UPI003D91FB07
MRDAAAALLGIGDADELARVSARLDDLARALPAPARIGLRAGAGAVEAASVLLTGHRLGALPADRRDAVCAALAARPAGGRLVEALKVPMLLAEGAVRHGVIEVSAEGAAPDAELDCTPSGEWPSCGTADAVVIGSGAGGAMAARTLARAGLAVVVLEEGRRHTAAEFRTRAPLDRLLDVYRDGGASFALGRPPVLLPEGRAVGGTTLINSGTCYRTPDRVLRRWGTDPERFGAYLDEVEATLRVAPQPADVLGRNGRLALAGAARLGWRAAPLRRNAPGCGGSSQCAAGCPRNAKNGVHLNALPQACAAGARIVTHARVERIIVERGRATGVRARRPDGTALEILAPLVVVAAGALQTPPLLRRSGLGGHPGLGRGMAVHPATNLAGRFDEPVVAWSGVMQSVGVEELHDDGILIEATAGPPGMSAFAPPGVGRRLRAELAGADRLAVLGAMIADAPSGRVHGRRRALPRYDLARADAARLRRALVAMGRLMFAAGAREVLTGLPRRPVAATVDELAGAVASTPAAEMRLAGFHPTGTARMGPDPEHTPVDPSGRLRGVGGVHVADASVLPTCPEVNPQLTVMAMALFVADQALGSPPEAAR